MKYCHRCHQLTRGQPVFCNYCGSTFGVKLCGRLHPNARSAQVCSACGSRDFSTPQPKVPILFRPFVALLNASPRLIAFALVILSVYVAYHVVAHDPRFLNGLVCLAFLTCVLAILWKVLPKWLQQILRTTFHVVTFLLRTIFRLFFSKNRAAKGVKYRM